jgi:hypothetical protein
VANCLKYKEVSEGSFRCAVCELGHLLRVNADSSVECLVDSEDQRNACTVNRYGSSIVSGNITDLKINECQSAQASCRVRTPRVDQTGASSTLTGCAVCGSNMTKTIDFASNSPVALLVYAQDLETTHADPAEVYELPEGTCVSEGSLSVVEGASTENCQYFYDVENGKQGCLKCRHGHSGPIVNWGVRQCKQYDAATKKCVLCMNKYKLSASGLECLAHGGDANCRWFQSHNDQFCEICNPGFYLNASQNACVAITPVAHCSTYKIYEDRCSSCAEGFQFDVSGLKCHNSISRCVTYEALAPTTDLAKVKCTACRDGYYPYGLECVEGNQDECWAFDQSKENVCQSYQQNILFEVHEQCELLTPIEGCIKQNNEGVCQECDSATHYMETVSKKCCKFGTYYDSEKKECRMIQINDCKKSFDALECDECQDNYYLDTWMADLQPPYMCCGEGTFYDFTSQKCTASANLVTPYKNCGIFDVRNMKCLRCAEDMYETEYVPFIDDKAAGFTHGTDYKTDTDNKYAKERHCCPEKFYYNAASTKEDKCDPITDLSATVHTLCARVAKQGDGSFLCTKCQATNDKGEELFFSPTNRLCCIDGKEFDDTTQTSPLTCTKYADHRPNCIKMSLSHSFCEKCENDHWSINYGPSDASNAALLATDRSNNYCCPTNQYLVVENGEPQCKDLNALKADENNVIDAQCIHWNEVDKKCHQCSSGLQVTNDGLFCCPEGQAYNGVMCIDLAYLMVNCDDALGWGDKNYCTQCKTGFYKFLGVCVPYGGFYVDFQNNDADEYDGAHNLINRIKAMTDYHNEAEDATGTFIPHCKEYDDTSTDLTKPQCKTCHESFQKGFDTNKFKCISNAAAVVDLDKNLVVSQQELVANCLEYDTSKKQCKQCRGNYYMVGSNSDADPNMCCAYNQKQKNDKTGCEDYPTGDANGNDLCKMRDASGNCTRFDTSNANHKVDKCEIYQDGAAKTCLQCQLGFVLVDNACVTTYSKIKELACYGQQLTNNCKTLSATACECATCRAGTYLSRGHCCRYGFIWDEDLQVCERASPAHRHCATFTYDSGTFSCDECFVDWAHLYIASDLTWTHESNELGFPKYAEGLNETVTGDALSGYFYKKSTHCCPKGTYWDTTKKFCEKLTNVAGCSEGENGTDPAKCTACFPGYSHQADNTCDLVADCGTEHYKPTNIVEDSGSNANSQCCPENYFFDKELGRCQKLLDPNCLESNTIFGCTTCKTNYSTVGGEYATYVRKVFPTVEQQAVYQIVKVRMCVATENVLSYFQFHALTNVGTVFWNPDDYSKTLCKTWHADKYYNLSGSNNQQNVCCKKDHVARDHGNNIFSCSPVGEIFNEKQKRYDYVALVGNGQTSDDNPAVGSTKPGFQQYYSSMGVHCAAAAGGIGFLKYNVLTGTCDIISELFCKKWDDLGAYCHHCFNGKKKFNGVCIDNDKKIDSHPDYEGTRIQYTDCATNAARTCEGSFIVAAVATMGGNCQVAHTFGHYCAKVTNQAIFGGSYACPANDAGSTPKKTYTVVGDVCVTLEDMRASSSDATLKNPFYSD